MKRGLQIGCQKRRSATRRGGLLAADVPTIRTRRIASSPWKRSKCSRIRKFEYPTDENPDAPDSLHCANSHNSPDFGFALATISEIPCEPPDPRASLRQVHERVHL
jgi:hypothetical protein